MVDRSDMLAALTADYCNVYIVDLARDLGQIVKLEGWDIDVAHDAPERLCYSKNLAAYVATRVFEADRETFTRTLSNDALAKAFSGDRKRLELSYRVLEDGEIHHYNVQYTRISEPGEPLKLVVAFRNVDSIAAAQKKMRDEGRRSAYAALSQIYLAMFRVNLRLGTYEAIKETDAIRQFETGDPGSFADNALSIIKGLAEEASFDNAMEFVDLSTLGERMDGRDHISTLFTGRIAGQCKLHFIREDSFEDGCPHHAIFAVELADEDKLVPVFDVLARNFQNVFWIDLAGGMAKVLKLDGYITKGLDRNDHQYFPYPAVLRQYTNDRVHPDEQQAFYDAVCIERLREAFGAEGKTELVGNYHILVDGETHNFQYNYAKMTDEDFVVCGFQNIDAIVEEATARDRAEREKEALYKAQLEEQLHISENLSRNYRNVYVANIETGTAKILKLGDGYDLEVVRKLQGQVFPYDAVLDQWVAQRVHPDDRQRVRGALNTQAVREGLSRQEELTGVYRAIEHGRLRNYQYSVSKIDDEGNILIGFQVIDAIIEEHLAEEKKQREREEAYQRELIAARDEADRANSAKTDFLLRMSHDIRTPLNGIIGMLEIADRFPDDLDKQTDCREKVRESSKTLLELINEVLDMSKLESGEIVLERVPLNMAEVSREVYNAVRGQAEERGVQIVQEGCEAQKARVLGSPTHVKRLLMNIVSNAIKYNKQNGKVYLSCRESEAKDGVVTFEFVCRDTGIGMSEEFQKRIFEPFAQELQSPRTTYAGTGLGMSIAKSIVDKMGGSISFTSVQGEGTTFTVLMPFDVDESAEAEVAAVDEAEGASIEGLNILVVEDNDLNLEIAQFLLEEEGAKVVAARDGQEAVDAFAASEPGHFDAVLMDVMMPVMGGYEATRTIRALDRDDAATVPIIAMTANAFAEDKIHAREAGMNEHVSKPLDIELLVSTIARLAAR